MMGEPRWKTNRPRPRFVNKLQLLPKMLYGNIASLPISETFCMRNGINGIQKIQFMIPLNSSDSNFGPTVPPHPPSISVYYVVIDPLNLHLVAPALVSVR